MSIQPGNLICNSNGTILGITMSTNYASNGIMIYSNLPSYSIGASYAASGIMQTTFPFMGVATCQNCGQPYDFCGPGCKCQQKTESTDEEGICLECNWSGPNFEPCQKHIKMDG